MEPNYADLVLHNIAQAVTEKGARCTWQGNTRLSTFCVNGVPMTGPVTVRRTQHGPELTLWRPVGVGFVRDSTHQAPTYRELPYAAVAGKLLSHLHLWAEL